MLEMTLILGQVDITVKDEDNENDNDNKDNDNNDNNDLDPGGHNGGRRGVYSPTSGC